jgi:antitoxin component of RelBE/YafQ-DinJ toxin-antitoxin module
MSTENQEIEIELDDNTAAIAHIMAEEKGITVDQLITELLSDAIETGYFDNPENITTDDPLE